MSAESAAPRARDCRFQTADWGTLPGGKAGAGLMDLITIEKVEVAPGVWSLTLRGSVDASNVAKLEGVATELLQSGARSLFIVLRKAEYVSSTGFSFFLKIADEAAARGGKVVFVGSPPSIKGIFKLLGLEGVLAFAADETAALALLTRPESQEMPQSRRDGGTGPN